jgi:hypothetical protein
LRNPPCVEACRASEAENIHGSIPPESGGMRIAAVKLAEQR